MLSVTKKNIIPGYLLMKTLKISPIIFNNLIISICFVLQCICWASPEINSATQNPHLGLDWYSFWISLRSLWVVITLTLWPIHIPIRSNNITVGKARMLKQKIRSCSLTLPGCTKAISLEGVMLTDADFALFWISAQWASWTEFKIVQNLHQSTWPLRV